MKVLIIQRHAAAFRKSLFEQIGATVDLTLLFSNNQNEIKSTFDINNCAIKFSRYYDIILKTFHLQTNTISSIKTFSPDVVVITPTPRNLTNFVIIIFCKLRGIRIVGWGMGQMPNKTHIKKVLHNIFVSMLVRNLDHLICYSTTAQAYYTQLGCSMQSTSVAFNGVDTLSKTALIPALRKNSEPGCLNVIAVGRLIKSKKFDVLLKAIANLPHIQLHLVGEGHELENLVELAEELNCSVTFHGYKSGSELHQLFLSSDIFVLPSLGGLAIHEAMLMGCPVICGRADGTEYDLVVNNRTGFLLPEMSVETLRQTLLKSSKDKHHLKKMGNLARRFILQRRSRRQLLRIFLRALSP